MSKDILRTAVFLNGLGAGTQIDPGLIDAALHPHGTNVVPFDLQGDYLDAERLTGVINNLEGQAALVNRRPSVTLVAVGPYTSAVALETAEFKNVMGVAALAPDLIAPNVPQLAALRRDGLEIVVFQPVFAGNTLNGTQTALKDLLGDDMQIQRRTDSVQRPQMSPDVIAALGSFSRRPPVRRGRPLPVT
jgi:hypothetical protein